MLAGKLLNVPIELFRADLMERSLMRSLEHRPEAFNAVGVGHAAHVFADRVQNRLMLTVHALIGRCAIGKHLGIFCRVVLDKILKRVGIRGLDHLGYDFITVPVLNADNGGFASHAPARVLEGLALGRTHVAALARNVGFIHLDRAVKRLIGVFTRPRLTNAVEHEPCCLLGDFEVPMQLHAGNRFKAGQAEINPNRPLMQGDFGVGHRGAGANAEIRPAIVAEIRHITVFRMAGLEATALGAMPLTAPDRVFKPLGSRFLSREHLHQFDDRHSLTVRFSRGFLNHFLPSFHANEISRSEGVCQRWDIIP